MNTIIENYQSLIERIPNFVIVDLYRQVNKSQSIRLPTNYIFNAIFEVIIDKNQIKRRLSRKTDDVIYQLSTGYEACAETYPRVSTQDYRIMFLPQLTEFETLIYEVLREIEIHKLYINNRYLPFCFEHSFDNGSVVLSKISDGRFLSDLIEI